MFNLLADFFLLGGKEFKNHITLFGSFDIYFYALAIVTGMVVCCIVAVPLFKRRGENPDFIIDLMIFIIPLAIIGSRIWYVVFDIKSSHSFKEVINIRDGGLAIYGGVLFGALGVYLACKTHKVKVSKCIDLAAAVLPLGQSIGRWGNFFNQEVYGGLIENPNFQFFPCGVQIGTAEHYSWYQALFFYEGVLNFLTFLIIYIFLWNYRGQRNGYCAGIYFICYGTTRGILENFRQAEYNLPFFGLEIKGMVIISILLVLAGILLILWFLYKDGVIFQKKKGDK